ncbi:MAG: hypothetical protein JNL08_12115 [Planctomycetes bacterium]|nr:hypothetical protein [Planctomycetota bacterium]
MTDRRDPPIDPADEAWRELDDTLADGPAPAAVPDAARRWLADQRLLHGLLRQLHTADAGSREARVAGILARIDADCGVARRWWVVAAAALLFAVLGVLWVLPAQLPTVEAAVARTVAELQRDVDRRYHMVVVTASPGGKERRVELALVARPGRFRIDGRLPHGTFAAGCDGAEWWRVGGQGLLRRAGPIAERDRAFEGLGDLLEPGYLDVQDLVRRLPQELQLRVVERTPGARGPQVRIEAVPTAAAPRGRLRAARLQCEEATGMVTELELDLVLPLGATRRLVLRYLGEEPAGLVDYSRPW